MSIESLDDHRKRAHQDAEAEFERVQAEQGAALDRGDVDRAIELQAVSKAAADRVVATLTEAERVAKFETVHEEDRP